MAFVPTPRQRAAIEAPLGPLLVVAGPGAGKTFCLIERIRYLTQDLGLAPERICAVTFTNKAAEEIAHRLELALGEGAHRVTRGTLHALCVTLLRQHGGVLRLRPGFGIADEEYQKLVLRRLGVDERRWGQLLGLFGRCRLRGCSLTEGDEVLLGRYRAWLAKRDLLDFDELILRAVELLQDHPGIAAEIAARWDYLLVDEFQDLNPRQYEIVRALAGPHRNVFAVGDDEQSIYAWAGADPEVLRRFARDFGIAEPIVLDENHRTPQEIFVLARRLLGSNPPLFAKAIRACQASGHEVVVRGFPTEREETAWLLADLVADREQSGLPWGDYALLYRRHDIGNALEGALAAAGIPCRLARGRALQDDGVVQFLIAALRLIQAPDDPLGVERLAALVLDPALMGQIRAARHPGEEFAAALKRFARSLPRGAPDRKAVWRTVYTVENLPGLAARHTDLVGLVEELLSRRVGPYRTPLEDRQEDLSDPMDLPAAKALAAELAGALHGRGRVWLPAMGGLEIALRGMLLEAGVTTADYLEPREHRGGAGRPGPGDLVLDASSGSASAGLPFALVVFKALQLVHAARAGQSFRAFVAFDLETTGLDVEQCEIVEIAAVRVQDGVIVDEFHSLVRPRVAVHPEAVRRHGYSEADLAEQPRFEEVWPRFRAFVGGDVLVAHNGHGFDVPVLLRMAAGLGGAGGLTFFDTLPLARAVEPGSARLEALAERFGVPLPRAHHALDDARALAGVTLELERRRAVIGRKTCLANLLDYLALGLALEGRERFTEEAAMIFEAARGYALGRYSECLTYYEQERGFAPGPAPALAEVIERLGGAALLERIRADRRAADRYPSTLARLQPFLQASRAPTLDESIRRLLDRLALTTSEGVEADRHRVNLLTLHSTKGLEFSRVYIVGVEDRQLPGKRALEEQRSEEIEEARRLLYVGMTRARERLVLTHVEERNGWRWGGTAFLREMGIENRTRSAQARSASAG
jgi:DNA polymerase III epsilon subunit family exonuclease